MFQFPLSRRRAQSFTEQTSPYYLMKESVKFGWGTDWEFLERQNLIDHPFNGC